MWIMVNNIKSVEIEDDVFDAVLNMYPEEKFIERKVIQKSINSGYISINDLKSECDKILIPWQMFFLEKQNLDFQIGHIEKQRAYKISDKFFAKRKGAGDVTSKRIIDRLIRQQNFVSTAFSFPKNIFCGSLIDKNLGDAANFILEYFDIDMSIFRGYSGKGKALDYLIDKIESKNINISRGVLANKLLPTPQVVHSDIYRNTSGFVIRDEFIPFVFLPSELNPEEVESRQIYTLIYLIVIIGLEEYDFFINKDFRAQKIKKDEIEKRIHLITSELLIPRSETDKIKGVKITKTLVDTMSRTLKVSPAAFVLNLFLRDIITFSQYEFLKPLPYVPKKQKNPIRTAKVSTSVRKFCGSIGFRCINEGLKKNKLSSIQAQHLIFGATNKKGFYKYRTELKI